MMSKGISDLTTSEGYLKRFSLICAALERSRAVGPEQIVDVVKRYTRLKHGGGALENKEVILRHIRIMSALGILKGREEGYAVSSEGKALLALVDSQAEQWDLSNLERMFYFRGLFRTAAYQLYLLLDTLWEPVTGVGGAAYRYYRQVVRLGLGIWDVRSVIRALDVYEKRAKLPRSFAQRIRCMLLWLDQLLLVRKEKLQLTESGKDVYLALKELFQMKHDISAKISTLLAVYKGGLNHGFHSFALHDPKDREQFLDLLSDARRLFMSPELHAIDARATHVYICLSLIDSGVILEELKFENVVRQLINEGILKSAVGGRDGRLAYIRPT